MFELEEVRTWERNPQYYADILASSLAGQALFTHAPAPERARRVLSKLRQTPRLIQAARDNIKEPPGIFVKVGIETMRGALKFIEQDLPRAFSSVDDLHLLGDLADAQTEASQAIGAYLDYLETDLGAARARVVPARARQVRAEGPPRRRPVRSGRSAAGDRHARAEGDAGGVQERCGPHERRRSHAGLGHHESRSSRTRRARRCRPPAARRAADVSRAAVDHHAAGRRADHRRADAGFLSLVVCQHVDARAVREQADRARTTT